MDFALAEKILSYFNISDKIFGLNEIAGGLLHKLYKVRLESGAVYAVKCLNPMIMARKTALKNMIYSEIISSRLRGEIPAVAAIEKDGKQIFEIDGQYVMLFEWIEGESVFRPNIKEWHCAEVGRLLGKIHSLQISVDGLYKEKEEYQGYEWAEYLQIAKEQNAKIEDKEHKAEWLAAFEAVFEKLMQYQALIIKAKPALSNHVVISHRDLDPKNVLWNGGKAYIIDWEAAGFINPYQELVEVINYWADDGQEGINEACFASLVHSYQKYVSLENVNWEEVLICSCDGMLGWLAYNIRRALFLETVDEKEAALGKEQIIITIKEIENYASKVQQMQKWLANI